MAVGEGSAGLASVASERMFGDVCSGNVSVKVSREGSCKSGVVAELSAGASAQIPNCPNSCKSGKIYRDGMRYNPDGSQTQRWLCTCCGLRFVDKALKTEGALTLSCQICAKEAKNLVSSAEILETAAGDKPKHKKPANFGNQPNIEKLAGKPRQLLEKFEAYLEREGYVEENQYMPLLAHLVLDGADLLDPESIKATIATQKKKDGEKWSSSYKMIATCAYDAFAEMQNITWKRPIYTQDEADVYLPARSELDLLINAARRKMATFLKTLDETMADPEEIIRCEWLDLHGNILSIRHPVKGHLTGKYELTPQLLRMINSLPRKNKRIFATSYTVLYQSFYILRANCAERFNNPLLRKITFKSYRHFGATMLARITNGNVPEMARILRHKNWKNTQKYVHLAKIPLSEEEYDTTTAVTPEEILELGKSGWQKYDESNFGGIIYHFYRKPKRFNANVATANPYTLSQKPCTKGS